MLKQTSANKIKELVESELVQRKQKRNKNLEDYMVRIK